MANESDLPGSQPVKPAGEHARDHDPTTGEPIHGKEPDDQTPAPVPAAAAAESEPEAEPEKKKPEHFKDNKRNAIFAKRDAMTTDERETFIKEQPEEAALSELVAGGDAELEEEPAAPAPAAPAAPAPAGPAPLAQERRTYKLTTYGKDAGEVSEEEVIQAGIATLQKERSVDDRMRQVATREEQLLKYGDDLQAFADNLAKGLDIDGQPLQPTGGSANPAPTPTGAAGAIDRAKVAKASSLLLRGDDDAGAQLLAEAVEEAIAAGRAPAPAPAPRKVEVPRLPAAPAPSDPWGKDQRAAANEVFNTEFSDLNDDQFKLAKQSVEGLMIDPKNKGRALEDLVRQAGHQVRRVTATIAPSQPAAPPAAPPSPLGQRRTLKARLPVTPPPASGRAPSAQPAATRYPTASDYVRQRQVMSGSNSSPRK